MDTEPVRVRKRDKTRLDELRQDLLRATGTRLSQQEIVAASLDFIVRHRDEFLRETGWRPLSEREIASWLSKTHRLGKWSAEDIDRIVYGERP